MHAFEYAHPASVKEALGLLGSRWEDAAVLAGGTDLLSLMKDRVVAPRRVVDLKGIAEFHAIRTNEKETAIGALATLEELLDHRDVRREFPALAQAAEGVTSPQIRNMGTVGGDLMQRPRCWYFRNGFGLLATENGRPLVPNGENQYHAIFGNSGPAYFVSASSLGPPLIALGAVARVAGPKGQREVPLARLFAIPKQTGERETTLGPDEILTEVGIPAAARGLRSATYEVRQKEGLDWPLATASVALRMESGKIASAMVVLGHVAPTPWREARVESYLVGKTVTEHVAEAAGKQAAEGATPLRHNAYKVQLARVAVKRALLAAAKGGA